MVTDPARVRRSDPGNPQVCPVYSLHKIFSDPETIAKVEQGCTTASIGCIECKSWAADHLISTIRPLQERRMRYESNPKMVWDILEAGSSKARRAAEGTMGDVRGSMHFSKDYEAPLKTAVAE
jgi:tryptophanyl-tRNA synthetase